MDLACEKAAGGDDVNELLLKCGTEGRRGPSGDVGSGIGLLPNRGDLRSLIVKLRQHKEHSQIISICLESATVRIDKKRIRDRDRRQFASLFSHYGAQF